MSRVTVWWSGRNRNRESRCRLVAAVSPFAEAGRALFPGEDVVLRFDGPVTGTALFRLPADIRRRLNSIETFESSANALKEVGGVLIGIPNPVSGTGAPLAWILRLPGANLHGIQWTVFDNCSLYRGTDRVGFVHLVLPQVPLFDGLMFDVQERRPYDVFDSPILGRAEWHLGEPGINLDYGFEERFDRFLAWIRFFYLPDLTYFRDEEPIPGWRGFERMALYRLRYGGLSRDELAASIARELLVDYQRSIGAATFSGGCLDKIVDEELCRSIDCLQTLVSSTAASDSAEPLLRLSEAILELYSFRMDFQGRADLECLARAGERLGELLALRRQDRDLVAFSRQRLEMAFLGTPWTHLAGPSEPAWHDPEQGEEEEQSASEDGGSIASQASLEEGYSALLQVPIEGRPPALLARYWTLLAERKIFDGDLVGAFEDVKRAEELWSRIDWSNFVTAEASQRLRTSLCGASALEKLERLEEATKRLTLAVDLVRERRVGKALLPREEVAAHLRIAELQQALGAPDAVRHRLACALEAYRELREGPYWRGIHDIPEVLVRVVT